jgi:predicted transcriptional regulator
MPGVSKEAKAVYALLCSYAGDKEYCFPTVQTLAADLETSERQIIRLTQELKDKGLVEKRKLDGDKRKTSYIPLVPDFPIDDKYDTQKIDVIDDTKSVEKHDTDDTQIGDMDGTLILTYNTNTQENTNTHRARAFALNNMPHGIREAVSEFVDAVDPTTNLGKCRIVAEIAVAELGAETVSAAIRQARDEVVSGRVEERFLQRSLFNLLRNIEGLKRRARLARPPDEEPEWIKRGGERAIHAVAFMLKHGSEIPEGARKWIEQARQKLNEQSEASQYTPQNAMCAETLATYGMT